MGRKVRLTEEQLVYILESQYFNGARMDMLLESAGNYEDFRDKLKRMIRTGAITAAIAIAAIGQMKDLSNEKKAEISTEIAQMAPKEEWAPIAEDAVITVYNARPEQCNSDFGVTASGFRLNLNNVGAHKIVAMERTFMAEHGLKYGDVIKIVGTYQGKQDGIYQIQDTMNKRFAGQHKVDVLVPDNIRYGGTLKGQYATIYVLADKEQTDTYKLQMAPALSKYDNIKQMAQKRELMAKK